jgi:metal-responsive CopG/Arc/MetJ family transcriptional regulator
MSKHHVIQVPVDDELHDAIAAVAKERNSSRAEVMREAFIHFQKRAREAELDRRYREGYERMPDEPSVGQAQVSVLKEVLSKENWSEKRRGVVGRTPR